MYFLTIIINNYYWEKKENMLILKFLLLYIITRYKSCYMLFIQVTQLYDI